MKLTDHIVASPGPVTADELAKITKGDKLLIGTFFRPQTVPEDGSTRKTHLLTIQSVS